MPVIPPRLDDLDYHGVEQMLIGRIPIVAPEWTDHHDSDPGVAMIQLFAHLAEQVGYRLNRVPEKTYVELLKLVGVRLAPAAAARTYMAFLLTKPERAAGVLIPMGARITAKAGDPPPDFETDAPLDIVPAQIAALITARDSLTSINGTGETGPTAAGVDPQTYVDQRFSIAWDGKSPKLKSMPTQPVPLFFKPSEATHKTLYIALALNQSLSAGFKGARATLHLQIDADEQPAQDAQVRCGEEPISIVNAFQNGPPLVEYAYYRPPSPGQAGGTWEPLQVLGDETDGWNRSGSVRFEVPLKIGPIPAASFADVEADLPHPLLGALKTPVDDTPAEVPVSGWLRVRFGIAPRISVRSLNFNTVSASNLATTRGERLGRGNGRAGQVFSLTGKNIAAGTLSLVSRDDTRTPPEETWRQVEDFDTAGPDDAVYVLDAEAGLILTGDGVRGRPPNAREIMIAMVYRAGGGLAGEAATGDVSKASGLPTAVSDAVNITPARGGRNAESLEAAKLRAPRAFRARGRAVTAADYADAAVAAPGVRIARAEVVPLHRPYPEGHIIDGEEAPGVDFEHEAPGALTVLVVPEADHPYPMPTTGELVAVARHLDQVRLLTTEVHVTTPQYVRLYDLQIVVRAAPGYTGTQLREAIGDHLKRRFHVLTGGPDGTGYPFGGLLHHADLVAEVFKVKGVERVEALSCLIDGLPPDGEERVNFWWRRERRYARRLINCIETPADTDQIDLFPDEAPFIDPSTLTLTIVSAP